MEVRRAAEVHLDASADRRDVTGLALPGACLAARRGAADRDPMEHWDEVEIVDPAVERLASAVRQRLELRQRHAVLLARQVARARCREQKVALEWEALPDPKQVPGRAGRQQVCLQPELAAGPQQVEQQAMPELGQRRGLQTRRAERPALQDAAARAWALGRVAVEELRLCREHPEQEAWESRQEHRRVLDPRGARLSPELPGTRQPARQAARASSLKRPSLASLLRPRLPGRPAA